MHEPHLPSLRTTFSKHPSGRRLVRRHRIGRGKGAKQYEPKTPRRETDPEIKIGNTMPYSGPASAMAASANP